jgi:hypothetical protein
MRLCGGRRGGVKCSHPIGAALFDEKRPRRSAGLSKEIEIHDRKRDDDGERADNQNMLPPWRVTPARASVLVSTILDDEADPVVGGLGELVERFGVTVASGHDGRPLEMEGDRPCGCRSAVPAPANGCRHAKNSVETTCYMCGVSRARTGRSLAGQPAARGGTAGCKAARRRERGQELMRIGASAESAKKE